MIAFDNQIAEDILECVEKANELMNQLLIKSICQKLIPLHSSLRKISSNHFVMQLTKRKFPVVVKQNPPKLTGTLLEL